MSRLRKLGKFFLARAQETSTVRGLAGAAVLLIGWQVDPARLDAWTTLAVFLSALLKVLLPDRWNETKPNKV